MALSKLASGWSDDRVTGALEIAGEEGSTDPMAPNRMKSRRVMRGEVVMWMNSTLEKVYSAVPVFLPL